MTPWPPLLSYVLLSHHVYVTKRQHYYPRVKIINHAVLSSGAAYPHTTDIKHVVYSHEDVRSRYSLILRIGFIMADHHMPVDNTRVIHVSTHSEIDAARELTMNRKIVTSYCMWGGMVRPLQSFDICVQVHLLMASKSSSLPPFLHHCKAVVDMMVITAKNRLRLIYLIQNNISLVIFPTGSATEKNLVSRLIRRGKVSPNLHRLCDSCSVRSIVASSPVVSSFFV